MTATTASGTTHHTTTADDPSRATAVRTATYGRHLSGILAVAFTLSAGHTVYAWVEGIEDPTFTVTTPLAWAFYVVGFGSAVLARRTGRVAQVSLLAYLAALLGISVFYYPTTFGAAAADDVRLVRERRVRGAAHHRDVPRGAAAAAHGAHADVINSDAHGQWLESAVAVTRSDDRCSARRDEEARVAEPVDLDPPTVRPSPEQRLRLGRERTGDAEVGGEVLDEHGPLRPAAGGSRCRWPRAARRRGRLPRRGGGATRGR